MFRSVAITISLLAIWPEAQGKPVDFTQCLNRIRQTNITAALSLQGSITDNSGNIIDIGSVLNSSDYHCPDEEPMCFVTAITYEKCKSACGTGREAASWFQFSQQFGGWLLPWLALLSQLPFGANDRMVNYHSVALTVGSPTLATYSLILTALNSRWIAHRLAPYHFPNIRHAVYLLSSLQQSPLSIATQDGLLASLVVLHKNDPWWAKLVEWLDNSSSHTWSTAAFANLAWVVVAFALTVANSFETIGLGSDFSVNGMANGLLWIWLLPIVCGWMVLSPKCDAEKLEKALKRAHNREWVATDVGGCVRVRSTGLMQRAIEPHVRDRDNLFKDQHASPPIFNYARIFTWTQSAETVALAFIAASTNHAANRPVARDGRLYQPPSHNIPRPQENREGSRLDVEAYCGGPAPAPHWVPTVWKRIALASVMAQLLVWGATGSAVINILYTPTKGLGCRSAAYLIYGGVSTLVWVLMLLSSILAHHAISPGEALSTSARTSLKIAYQPSDSEAPSNSGYSTYMDGDTGPARLEGHCKAAVATLAKLLRWTGKLLAWMNAVWVIVACIFQFINFYGDCYCNCSVLGLGSAVAYNVMEYNDDDNAQMKSVWEATLGMAMGSIVVFGFFFWGLLKPRMPEADIVAC